MSHQASHSSDGTQVRAFDSSSKLAVILIGAIAAIAGIVMGVANPFLSNAVSSQGIMIDTLFSVLLGIATASLCPRSRLSALFHCALCSDAG